MASPAAVFAGDLTEWAQLAALERLRAKAWPEARQQFLVEVWLTAPVSEVGSRRAVATAVECAAA
jgi:hypothetical protein